MTSGHAWEIYGPAGTLLDYGTTYNLETGHSGLFQSGGYGDPLERDLAAGARDLDCALIDRATAEATYGVVVASALPLGDRHRYTLDPEASEARRRSLRAHA